MSKVPGFGGDPANLPVNKQASVMHPLQKAISEQNFDHLVQFLATTHSTGAESEPKYWEDVPKDVREIIQNALLMEPGKLDFAIKQELVKYMAKNGYDFDQRFDGTRTWFDVASIENDLELAKILVAQVGRPKHFTSHHANLEIQEILGAGSAIIVKKDSTPPKFDNLLGSNFQISRSLKDQILTIANNTAAWSLYAGFIGSATQGVARLFFEGKDVLILRSMMFARLCYAFGSSVRSGGRILGSDVGACENLEAKEYARTSIGWSTLSLLSGIGVFAGHVIGPKGFQLFMKGPAFNVAGGCGTVAAYKNNESEKKENEHTFALASAELAAQHDIPVGKALEFIKETVPHITDGEYRAKKTVYTAGILAAAGGLLGGIPLVEQHYPTTYSKFAGKFGGKLGSLMKFAGKWGGVVNGVGYAGWVFYPLLVPNHVFFSKDLRLPKDRAGTWQTLRTNAIPEALFVGIAVTGASLAMRKMDSSLIKKAGEIVLNKMDVATGVFWGTAALGKELLHSGGVSGDSLLSSPFYSRSFYAGLREPTAKDFLRYIRGTNPKLPQAQISDFVRTLVEEKSLRSKLTLDQLKDVRASLETDHYIEERVDGNLIRHIVDPNHAGDECKPYFRAAFYAAQVRQKIETYKANLSGK